MYLEILKNNQYQYAKVKLSYKEYQVNNLSYNIGDEFKISDDVYKVVDYSIVDRTTYKYEECIDSKCSSYMKIVSPNVGEAVLILEIDNLNKLSDDFLNSAIGLKYNDITYTGKDIKLISKYQNKIYYSVPIFFKDANAFYLTLTMRNNKYSILLGGK